MEAWGAPLLEDGTTFVPFRKTGWRFVALFVTSLYLFGSYYAFDFPAASRGEILQAMHINTEAFATIMACYSLPNVILPMFGGVLIDKIGVRRSLVLFSGLCLLGQVLFTFGLQMRQFNFVCFGRLVFGLGGECLNVANSSITTQWFKGKELAFALGVSLTISRLGSIAAFNISPILFAHGADIADASWCAASSTAFSLAAAIGAAMLDRYADMRDARYQPAMHKELRSASSFHFSKVVTFAPVYWWITCSCVLLYIGFYPFTQVLSSDLLEMRGGLGVASANFYTSMPTMVSAVMSPLFGTVVDRIGCRPLLVALSTILFILVHLTLVLSEFEHIPLDSTLIWALYIILGIGISIYASVIWPMIPLTVESHSIGLAFGLTTSLQNVGLALGPLVIGHLRDEGHGSFLLPEVFLLSCVSCALVAAVAIWVCDVNSDGAMSAPAPRAQVSSAAAFASPNPEATPTAFAQLSTAWYRLLRSPTANTGYRRGIVQRLGMTH